MTTPLTQDLEDRLNRSQRELNVLYDVSCAMRTTLDLHHVLYIILTSVTAHTGLGFNRALLFLVNKKERRLECKVAIGPESGEHADKIWKYIESSKQDLDDLIQADRVVPNVADSSLFRAVKEIHVPIHINDGSLLANAFHKGAPIHILPTEIDRYQNDPLLKVFHTSELIIMPLKAKDAVNGLIIADNLFTRKPISPDDIRMFTLLANQAGLAIENSQLYEMVVEKSHTDPVTSLWNHGFFQETLTEELQAATKNKTPLSLAVIDIDNFKKLNDTYGHQRGDIVLKELAKILKNSSRDKDYVCRYGGEEFSVILVQTTKEQSYEIAERIRRNIEDLKFQDFIPGSTVSVTVSIGLASYPLDAISKEELIDNADKAMYIAKFGGKNRTCLSEPRPPEADIPPDNVGL